VARPLTPAERARILASAARYLSHTAAYQE
jgi:hypothetical protein